MSNAVDRLAAAESARTPGRWRTWGMSMRAATCPEQCSELKHSIPVATFHTVRDGHPRTFDLDYVVTVTNAMPEIIAVLRAAQTLTERPGVFDSGGSAWWDAHEALTDALAALESKVAK